MSDDQSERRRLQMQKILKSVLDAPQDKAHNSSQFQFSDSLSGSDNVDSEFENKRNPERASNASGFLGDERARVQFRNTNIQPIAPDSNGSETMIEEIVDGDSSNNDGSFSSYDSSQSQPPTSSPNSKVVLINKDIDLSVSHWIPNFANITHTHIRRVFSEHPDWQGVIRYDTFKDELMKQNPAPWGGANTPWQDIDTTRAKCWLSDKFGCSYATGLLEEVFAVIGHDNSYNSLQAEIQSFDWDGVPRLDNWVCTFLGAEDSRYHREIGKRFLISAVARAMEPGCKVDHVLVLEGKTSARKSSVIEILAGSRNYCDSEIDLNSTFSPAQLVGVWMYELPELVLYKAFSNEKSKAFLSRKIDDYSPKNVRRKIHQPRTNVFVSTTNQDVYLKDPTGDRRSWPCKVADKIDLDLISKYRDQLIAEALNCYRLYKNGYDEHKWWLDDEDENIARKEQEKRYMSDSWEENISNWLAKNESKVLKQGYITVSEILWYALKIKPGRAEKSDQMRVAEILTSRFHWTKGDRRSGPAGRIYPYYPPGMGR